MRDSRGRAVHLCWYFLRQSAYIGGKAQPIACFTVPGCIDTQTTATRLLIFSGPLSGSDQSTRDQLLFTAHFPGTFVNMPALVSSRGLLVVPHPVVLPCCQISRR